MSEPQYSEPMFSIVMEAKMRAIVAMIKRQHPDWNKDFIREALANLLNKSVEEELKL